MDGHILPFQGGNEPEVDVALQRPFRFIIFKIVIVHDQMRVGVGSSRLTRNAVLT